MREEKINPKINGDQLYTIILKISQIKNYYYPTYIL